jgi:hypothetical protein
MVLGNGSKRERKAFSNELPALLCSVLEASQLNRRDVRVSLQNRFKGRLRHRKTELKEVTTISLFTDDVERLLRDLYGDIESDGFTELMGAVKSTAVTLSSLLLPELGEEYNTACNVDVGAGRSLPPGEGVSTAMIIGAVEHAQTLILRIREVLSCPSAYGRYTVSFATTVREYWPAVQEWRPLAKKIRGGGEAAAALQVPERRA